MPPGVTLTAHDSIARLSAAIPAGQTIAVAFRIDGVNTTLSCTIVGPATEYQAPSTATVVLPATGKMAMNTVASAATGFPSVSWAMRVVSKREGGT